MYTVYILYSQSANRYYVGHTDDIEARMANHNGSGPTHGRYTRKNGPWNLVYTEVGFNSRSEAVCRERQIKAWKSRKKIEQLIQRSVGRVPTKSRD